VNSALPTNVKNPYSPQVRRTFSLIGLGFLFIGVEYAQNQSQFASFASANPSPQQPIALNRDVIVFNSNRTGNDEIYVMNVDGSSVRRLTNDDRFDSWWPRISPDRKQILFYRSPKGLHDTDYTKQSLWVMNSDSLSPRLLRAAGTDGWKIQGHAEWSPDGKSLAMFGGKEWKSLHIYMTDSNGQNPRRLTSRKDAHYVDPSWSPDGQTIVFTGCPPKRCGPKDLEVFTLVVSVSQPERQLTNDSIPDYDPYYSPDGTMIGWTSMVADTGAHGVWNIRLASADGAGVRFVTNDRNVNGYPAWSKDGKLMYFHRVVYGGSSNFGIYAIRPDGQDLK
jgi:Tol biopolymer transport system component